jgi:hypothetical protein
MPEGQKEGQPGLSDDGNEPITALLVLSICAYNDGVAAPRAKGEDDGFGIADHEGPRAVHSGAW